MQPTEPGSEFIGEISIREGVVFVNVPPQKLTAGAVFRLAAALASAGMLVLKDEYGTGEQVPG
ncbi:hypothetical protein BH789_gp053 [Gordonia phage GMA6]|uniref:Uncharacterized protein n=1 Tax=Gordonia phage GMA6 TaxID=1647285 RepID=A0A0K0NL62_9CAUD|nr:hypothetical protein BH789_gp053 [Gordonia phage GMA6]AKL88334.1 hypothetical protein GMA6_53 [Gordonia phage GMA6]